MLINTAECICILYTAVTLRLFDKGLNKEQSPELYFVFIMDDFPFSDSFVVNKQPPKKCVCSLLEPERFTLEF